eukprot:scaffold22060_cov68-Phaeocystis_antarctica.AAC.6
MFAKALCHTDRTDLNPSYYEGCVSDTGRQLRAEGRARGRGRHPPHRPLFCGDHRPRARAQPRLDDRPAPAARPPAARRDRDVLHEDRCRPAGRCVDARFARRRRRAVRRHYLPADGERAEGHPRAARVGLAHVRDDCVGDRVGQDAGVLHERAKLVSRRRWRRCPRRPPAAVVGSPPPPSAPPAPPVQIHATHAPGPHYYAAIVAVDPPHQKRCAYATGHKAPTPSTRPRPPDPSHPESTWRPHASKRGDPSPAPTPAPTPTPSPTHCPRGHTGRMVRELSRLADAEGLPCYLEASGEANRELYRHLGYEVVGTYAHDEPAEPDWPDMVHFYAMVRPARATTK